MATVFDRCNQCIWCYRYNDINIKNSVILHKILLIFLLVFCLTDSYHCMVTPSSIASQNTSRYLTGPPSTEMKNQLSVWETVFVCIAVLLLMVTISIIIAWVANNKSNAKTSITGRSTNKVGYETFESNKSEDYL